MADLYYIDSDYFTPDAGYYVYTANAEATLTSSATVTCVIGLLQSVSATASAHFTPTLTVEVLKNHTALIDAVVTMSTDAVVNRSITQTLDSIANVNAMAVKRVDIFSTMATTASQTTFANRIQVLSTDLSTSFSLSINAGKLKSESLALTVTSSIFVSRYTNGRPFHIVSESLVVYDPDEKKYGTHSLKATNGSGFVQTTTSPNFTLKANQDFIFEFWIRPVSTPSSNNIPYFEIRRGTTPHLQFRYAGAGYVELFYVITSGLSSTTLSASVSITSAQWQHFAVRRTSGTLQILKNNSVVASTTYTGNFDTGLVGTYSLRVMPGRSNDRIDEFSFRKNASNILGYTEPVVNDPATHIALYHFDNNGLDDITLLQSTSASLTSTATLSAQANANIKQAAGNLICSSSLVSTIAKVFSFDSNLTATATLTSTVERIRSAASTVDSNFALTSIVGNIKQFALTELSAFNTGIDVVAQLAGVALLESFVSLSATAVKTVDGVQSLSTAFSLSAIPTTTSGASAGWSSAFTQTTSAERIRVADSNISASTTLAVDIVKVRQFASALSSSVAMTTVIDHYVGFIVLNAGSFSLTADASRTLNLISTPASTATLSAIVTRIQTALAALSSSATVSATAAVTANTIIDLIATATSVITAVKTANAQPVLDSIATQLTAAVKNASGTITLESTASLTALTGVIKQLEPNRNLALEIYSSKSAGLLINNSVSLDDVNLAISIWARRNSNSGDFQPLWAYTFQSGPYAVGGAFTLRDNDVILRFNNDPDEPTPTWNDVAPTDTDWHHYLIYRNKRNPIGSPGSGYFALWYDLWIDGVHQGQQPRPFGGASTFPDGQYLQLGNALINRQTGDYTPIAYKLDGSLAQIWVGYIPYHPDLSNNVWPIDPTLFYDNGYLDLGANGRGFNNLLPEPEIYSPLDSPWTDVNLPGYSTAEKPASQPLYYSNIIGHFTLTGAPVAVLEITANLPSTAAITAQAFKQVVAGASLSTTASLTATANAFTGVIAGLNSESTVLATATRIQTVTADLSTTATIVAIIGFEQQFAVLAMSAGTLVCDATVIFPIRTSADLSTTATIVAIIGQFDQADASLTVTVTLVCEPTEILPISGSADLSSEFTITTDVTTFSGLASIMEVSATVIADVTLIPPIRIDATLQSTATMTAIVGGIEQFAVLVASSGTLLVTATRIQTLASVLQSTVSITVLGSRFKGFTAELNSQGFVLTLGTVINIDPYLTLVVAPETRYYYVLPENRVRIIESETRVNIV